MMIKSGTNTFIKLWISNNRNKTTLQRKVLILVLTANTNENANITKRYWIFLSSISQKSLYMTFLKAGSHYTL